MITNTQHLTVNLEKRSTVELNKVCRTLRSTNVNQPNNLWQRHDPDQEWNQESSCFSTSGFSNTDDVAIQQANWYGLSLDWRRFLNKIQT